MSKKSIRNKLIAGSSAAVIGTAGYLGARHGIDMSWLNEQYTPQPDVIPEMVDGMVVVNEGIRDIAPVTAAGVFTIYAYNSLSSRLSSSDAAIQKMSKLDYSGLGDIDTDMTQKIVSKKANALKKGTGIAAAAILLTGSTSGLENEVSNGPIRPVEAMTSVLGVSDDSNAGIILQSAKNTFMDDSYIQSRSANVLETSADYDGVTLVPFRKDLMNIDGKSALEVSIPDDLFEKLTYKSVEKDCDQIPAIIDETANKKVGSTIDINGTDAKVVKVEDGIAQMNRSIAILPESLTKKCLTLGTDRSYFGIISPNANASKLEEVVKRSGISDVSATSLDEFKENNRDFWRANGTPILLQLIAYLAVFGGFAAAGERKNALQKNVNQIGMLQANGVGIKEIHAIERRRAIDETVRASLIAAPLMPVMAGLFNASELGLEVGVGPREVAVGISVMALAKLTASRSAVKKFEQDLDLSRAVKG